MIVNPYAGSGKTMKKWTEAEELLVRKGVAFITAMPGNGANVLSLAQAAAERGERRFISVGGDGTAHDILHGILNFIESSTNGVSLSDFTLAVIPIGSGNDWIRSHNIPRNLDKVTDLIASNSISRQDVVKAQVWNTRSQTEAPSNKTYMLNVAGGALDARICARVNFLKRQGRHGSWMYFKALLHVLMRNGNFDVVVHSDGRKIFDGSMYSVAFGTGKYSGGGMRQTGEAVLDDGLTDMVLVPSSFIPWRVYYMYRLYTSAFAKTRGLVLARASVIDVVPKAGTHPVKVEVDGENIGTMPLRLTVLPEQINVLHNFEK